MKVRWGIQSCSYHSVVFLCGLCRWGKLYYTVSFIFLLWNNFFEEKSISKLYSECQKDVTVLSSAFLLIHVNIWKNIFILRDSSGSLDLLFV